MQGAGGVEWRIFQLPTFVRFSYSGDRNRYIRLIGGGSGGNGGGDSNERFVVRPSELWRARAADLCREEDVDLGKSRGWTLVGDRRVSNGVRHGMQLKSVRVGYGLNISPSAADHKATDSAARGGDPRAESGQMLLGRVRFLAQIHPSHSSARPPRMFGKLGDGRE